MTGQRSWAVPVAAAAVGLVVACFVLLLATSETGRGNPQSIQVIGKVAPEVVATTRGGDGFDLSEWRGDWSVVNFFATWCPGCVLEHPELVEFDRRHAGDGTRLVSVVFEDELERVNEFFDDNGGDWPVLVGDTGRIATEFGVTAMPETYLISPSGRVVTKWIGATGVTADALDDTIAELTASADG